MRVANGRRVLGIKVAIGKELVMKRLSINCLGGTFPEKITKVREPIDTRREQQSTWSENASGLLHSPISVPRLPQVIERPKHEENVQGLADQTFEIVC